MVGLLLIVAGLFRNIAPVSGVNCVPICVVYILSSVYLVLCGPTEDTQTDSRRFSGRVSAMAVE